MIKHRDVLIALCVLLFAAGGCSWFSGDTDTEELNYPATEVGEPVGPPVAKDIGRAGGTLVSPDGRLTLTVPPDALAETVAFSIQPVSNKFEAGLGLSYRLEPDGETFDTPLDISMHYDDHDLEGTFPEALSIAYQDKVGAWHMQREIYLDKDKKTITFATTHFSVFDLVFRTKLSPTEATIRVGESLKIVAMDDCNPVRYIFGIVFSGHECSKGWGYDDRWKLMGEGKLTMDYPYMIYTAPGKKPPYGRVTVVFYKENYLVTLERPCGSDDVAVINLKTGKVTPRKCYKRVPGPKTLQSVITIVDDGYRVSGSPGGDTVISGYICDAEKPFTLQTTNPFLSSLSFVPSSANGGAWSVTTKSGITGGSSGQYTINDAQLVISGFGTGCAPGAGCVSGGGTGLPLTLTRLAAGEECGIK